MAQFVDLLNEEEQLNDLAGFIDNLPSHKAGDKGVELQKNCNELLEKNEHSESLQRILAYHSVLFAEASDKGQKKILNFKFFSSLPMKN